MKKAEIKVGGEYFAKVNGHIVPVRVDAIREVLGRRSCHSSMTRNPPTVTAYDVTNLKTGRETYFRSAMKFRSEVKEKTDPAPQSPKNPERDYDPVKASRGCSIVHSNARYRNSTNSLGDVLLDLLHYAQSCGWTEGRSFDTELQWARNEFDYDVAELNK